jgi:hypothetical protein
LRRAIFILHVVGEHHQLRDVDEAPEARVATARDDAVALGQHAFAVVGFLTSMKASGMPLMSKVMSGRNSSSPFLQVSSVTTWKLLLSNFSKSISRAPERSQAGHKGFAEVFVIEEKFDVGQQTGDVICTQVWIDPGNCIVEKRWKDVGFFVPSGALQGKIAVAKPHQMQDAGILTRESSLKIIGTTLPFVLPPGMRDLHRTYLEVVRRLHQSSKRGCPDSA